MVDPQTALLVWIPLLPLVGAALNGLWGRHFPRALVAGIGCGSVGLAFGLGVWASLQVLLSGGEARLTQHVYEWIAVPGLSISMSFMVDALSAIMVLVVSGVSSSSTSTRLAAT